nr:serine hydrolase domain-containing protein [uncultured Hyphomonas sp.]
MPEAGFTTRLSELMQEVYEDTGLDGAAVAVSDGNETHSAAAGFANRLEGIEATRDTLFHIGSVTKAITAELIWRLVSLRRLRIDAPVAEVLPEITHLRVFQDREITVDRLLSHTSGLDGDVMPDVGQSRDVLRQFMCQVGELDALATPGVVFSYSNFAYNVLGRIIETCGGKAFEDALSLLLQGQYNLTHFACVPDAKLRFRTAVAFNETPSGPYPLIAGPGSNIASGTILAMSVPDLVRWASQVIRTDAFAHMMQPQVRLPHSHRYDGWGAGLAIVDEVAGIVGHDGGTAGTSTFLRIAPQDGMVWALSCTGAGAAAAWKRVDAEVRQVLKQPVAKAKTFVPASVPDPALYAGTYKRHGTIYRIEPGTGGTLVLNTEGETATPLLNGLVLSPVNETIFEARIEALKANLWVSFHEFQPDGRPSLFYALERMSRRTESNQ